MKLESKNNGEIMKFLIGFFILIVMSGCADTISFSTKDSIEIVGFWYGLWHGMISPFAYVVSLFSDSTAIYAIYNNGGWYDLGFILGIGPPLSFFAKRTTRR